MIRIDVRVLGEEAILRLETLPKRLRGFLEAKMRNVLGDIKTDLMQSNKYLDPKYLHEEIETTGSLLIGTVEAEDKPGTYPIFPSKARALRFIGKSGDVVFTRKVDHPFLKGAPVVEKYFRENKPHIIEQLEDTVFDAVYNAR